VSHYPVEFQYFSQIRPNQQPSPPISTVSILKHQNGNRNQGKVRLLCLEEKDGAVAEIKVDEVLGLVRNKGAEVASDNAMPGRPLALIELEGRLLVGLNEYEELVTATYGLLDELSDVLLKSPLAGKRQLEKRADLLDSIFGHSLLCCTGN